MHTRTFLRHLLIASMICLVALLATGPILSQGNGNNGDHGRDNAPGQVNNPGQGRGDNHSGNGQLQSTPEPLVNSSDIQLACQKNNPDRLDCSSLEVSGICEGDAAIFTIRNTGEPGDGDMVSSTEYRLVVDGVVVESGIVLLDGDGTMEITYTGGGTVTLEADQQIGHPGNNHPKTTLHCAPVQEPVPTEEPAPTEEPVPTEEPTPLDQFALIGDSYCSDGFIHFIVTNTGGDMVDTLPYVVVDDSNTTVDEGNFQLVSDESLLLDYVNGYGGLTLIVADGLLILTTNCAPVTEEPPVGDPPILAADGFCAEDGSTYFVVTNSGGDMVDPVDYEVVSDAAGVIDFGSLFLLGGESITLSYLMPDNLTLTIDGGLVIARAECSTEPVPTEEPTPDAAPNLFADAYCSVEGLNTFSITNLGDEMVEPAAFEVIDAFGTVESGMFSLLNNETFFLQYELPGDLTLIVGNNDIVLSIACYQATEEPVPTEEPAPTEEPVPGVPPQCQNSNPDRLDCSSLQVTGMCVGGVAVFTITNTGESNEGDMAAPTEYRLIVGYEVIESGIVQLEGGGTMEIQYTGGGTVTLEADQQIGHPGNSQPQSTLHCAP